MTTQLSPPQLSPPRQLVPLVEVPTHREWTSVRWLRRAVYEGLLPYHKVIGKVLIDLADVDAFAERGRHEAATP